MATHNPSMACTKCRFFDDHASNGGSTSDSAGLCRFNPPVSQPADAHGLWPVVTDADWCGHFAPETTGASIAAE